MASVLNTKEALAREILLPYMANTVFMTNSWRNYETQMVKWVSDTAAQVDIRLPNNYLVNKTWDVTSVDRTIDERYVSLIADQIANVSFDIDSFEATFKIDQEKAARTTEPAAINLSLDTDNYLALQLFYNSYHHLGTPGTLMNSWATVSSMTAYQNDLAMPDGGMRIGVLSEETYGSLGADANLQNSNVNTLSNDITRKWRIGNLANQTLYHNHAIVKHTAGIGDVTATPSSGQVAAGAIKTAVSSGTVMVVKDLGTETGVFLKGDKITIPNRQFLHPKTLNPTGRPFQVTVTDTSVDSVSGDATVNFLPAIVTTGKYQNIDAELAVDDNLILSTGNSGLGSATKGTYTANIFYHKSGLIFAAPQLKMLFKDDGFVNKDGISLRVSSNGDILKSLRTTRIDTFYGSYIDGTRTALYLG